MPEQLTTNRIPWRYQEAVLLRNEKQILLFTVLKIKIENGSKIYILPKCSQKKFAKINVILDNF